MARALERHGGRQPNPGAFLELLEIELERAGRSGRPLALVAIELDSPAVVSEAVAEDARELLEAGGRRADVVERTGPQEFAVLLPETREREGYVLAERLRIAVKRALPLTLSLGVASAPKDAHQADLLLAVAVKARRAAVELGRDRTVLFSDEVPRVLAEAAPEGGANLEPLFKLAEALDVRDSGTAAHSKMVGRYCEMMARRLGLEGSAVERVRLAGLLHDVGKIGVPDSILRKPAELEEGEWAHMRRHPEIGARLLGDDAPDIRDGVLAHHERPDGKGYPLGLAGTAIPLEARILAVADAFEAMTTDRVYSRARSASEACAELRRHAGTQFDPLVVSAFMEALEEAATGVRSEGWSRSSMDTDA